MKKKHWQVYLPRWPVLCEIISLNILVKSNTFTYDAPLIFLQLTFHVHNQSSGSTVTYVLACWSSGPGFKSGWKRNIFSNHKRWFTSHSLSVYQPPSFWQDSLMIFHIQFFEYFRCSFQCGRYNESVICFNCWFVYPSFSWCIWWCGMGCSHLAYLSLFFLSLWETAPCTPKTLTQRALKPKPTNQPDIIK